MAAGGRAANAAQRQALGKDLEALGPPLQDKGCIEMFRAGDTGLSKRRQAETREMEDASVYCDDIRDDNHALRHHADDLGQNGDKNSYAKIDDDIVEEDVDHSDSQRHRNRPPPYFRSPSARPGTSLTHEIKVFDGSANKTAQFRKNRTFGASFVAGRFEGKGSREEAHTDTRLQPEDRTHNSYADHSALSNAVHLRLPPVPLSPHLSAASPSQGHRYKQRDLNGQGIAPSTTDFDRQHQEHRPSSRHLDKIKIAVELSDMPIANRQWSSGSHQARVISKAEANQEYSQKMPSQPESGRALDGSCSSPNSVVGTATAFLEAGSYDHHKIMQESFSPPPSYIARRIHMLPGPMRPDEFSATVNDYELGFMSLPDEDGGLFSRRILRSSALAHEGKRVAQYTHVKGSHATGNVDERDATLARHSKGAIISAVILDTPEIDTPAISAGTDDCYIHIPPFAGSTPNPASSPQNPFEAARNILPRAAPPSTPQPRAQARELLKVDDHGVTMSREIAKSRSIGTQTDAIEVLPSIADIMALPAI
jgi:hypothetical protein